MVWFIERVRGRVIAAGGAPLRGIVRLNEPSAAQRAAAVKLVGRPRRDGSALRIDLGVVEQILRRGPWPAGLADAVETVSGPIVDRRAEREREAAAWEAVREDLSGTIAQHPRLGTWWNAWCSSGALKRAARAEADRVSTQLSPSVAADLVAGLVRVFEELPASGEPLAVLAGRVVGDAHGLDASRPLGRLAATAVGVAFLPDAEDRHGEPSVRDAWAAGGVVLSNVASTVLCLGVPGTVPAAEPALMDTAVPDRSGAVVPDGAAAVATAACLEAMRTARMPLLLTLDQVRSGGVRELPSGSTVHVCENPTVVEVVAAHWARNRFTAVDSAESGEVVDSGASADAGEVVDSGVGAGAGVGADVDEGAESSGGEDSGVGADTGPVLVCTWGQPSTAVLELLDVLTAVGAECRYHGDFDWAGLRIAESLAASVPWTPWRYAAGDYRAAVAAGKPSRRLTGRPAASPWDPELSEAMIETGLALEEEAVADLLAADILGP